MSYGIDYRTRLKTFIVVRENSVDWGRATSPRTAIPILRAIMSQEDLDVDQEHMIVVALNARGIVMGYKSLTKGTATGTLITPAQVFRAGLVLGASSVIMCHNHPSNSLEPSEEDKALTRRCRSCGDLLGVPLADHIILTDDGYHSFRAAEMWDSNL